MAKLLMISTDRLIFDEKSAVRARQIENARMWEEVHIIVFDKIKSEKLKVKNRERPGILISPNCWIYSTQSKSKFMYPLDALRMGADIIKRNGITEITCQDASLTAWAGVRLKNNFNLPLELQMHEDIGSPYYSFTLTNKIRKFLTKRHIPQADRIRVVSSRIKRYLVGQLHLNETAIGVRPIAVDIGLIKKAPIIPSADLRKKYPQFKKIVLMASRLEPEKNVALAISAWTAVIKKAGYVALIIVGKGSQESILKNKVASSGLGGSVIFESWTDRNTLISYYKTANIFLNTSLFEGYGMTLVEAQAAGCKIVSTDVGVARETGAVVVTWDEEAVARSIIDALT